MQATSDKDYPTFMITENDEGLRPAGMPDTCFYCGHKIGDTHEVGCVITWKHKKVKLVALVEFEEEVPEHWDNDRIMFRYNDSTWCASNLWDRFDEKNCGCDVTNVYFPSAITSVERKK